MSEKTVEKAAEKKPETMDELIAKAVGQAIEKALPAAVAVAAKVGQPTPKLSKERLGECEKCHQSNGACKGEHRFVVVGPTSRKAWKFFSGIHINGVRYMSNHPGHKIWVPADANVEYMVERFENNEEELSDGRDAVHNSGVMGPAGKQITPAVMAWR